MTLSRGMRRTFRDNSVESRSSVSETVLSSAELTEVTSGLGDNIVVYVREEWMYAKICQSSRVKKVATDKREATYKA